MAVAEGRDGGHASALLQADGHVDDRGAVVGQQRRLAGRFTAGTAAVDSRTRSTRTSGERG